MSKCSQLLSMCEESYLDPQNQGLQKAEYEPFASMPITNPRLVSGSPAMESDKLWLMRNRNDDANVLIIKVGRAFYNKKFGTSEKDEAIMKDYANKLLKMNRSEVEAELDNGFTKGNGLR